jgi:hypothetical protein
MIGFFHPAVAVDIQLPMVRSPKTMHFFANSLGAKLIFGNGTGDSFLEDNNSQIYNYDFNGVTTYTPQQTSAVPGPVPILGAAAALGWSRRVRSRLRNAQRSAR